MDRPGEHLSGGGKSLLGRLGVGDLLLRDDHRDAHSVLSCWGSENVHERHAVAQLEGAGVILNRTAFERDLQREVLANGVEILETEATSVHRQERSFLVENGIESLQADFVFDATGRRAMLAASLSQLFRADQLVGAYAFASSGSNKKSLGSPMTLVEAAPDGWWYASLLADGRLSLAYFTDPDQMPKGIAQDPDVYEALLGQTHYLQRYISENRFQFGEPPRVTSAGTSWTAPCAGSDWAAVGDAAAAFDPLSSHGMTTALWTGIAAADAYAASLQSDDGALAEYAFKVAQGLQSYLESRVRIYSQETRFSNRPFWARRR